MLTRINALWLRRLAMLFVVPLALLVFAMFATGALVHSIWDSLCDAWPYCVREVAESMPLFRQLFALWNHPRVAYASGHLTPRG